ncbi:MAG: hypothetical protein IKU25_05215 [Clostridia bacterium]|nr:hypothetical protein [Clostridia bacterium]
MSKYYYIATRLPDGKRGQGVYTLEEKNAVTFDPDVEVLFITDFTAKSKDEAREIAIDVWNMDAETVNADGEHLSWGEVYILGNSLEQLARRFGLLREFRENGIL